MKWPEKGDVVYVVCEHIWPFNSPKSLQRDFAVDKGTVWSVNVKASDPTKKYDVTVPGKYNLHYTRPGGGHLFYSPWDAIGQAWENTQKEIAWNQKLHSDKKSDVLIPPGTMDRLNRWKALGLKKPVRKGRIDDA